MVSQAGQINSASGPVPPSVATSYITDINGPTSAVANVLALVGGNNQGNFANGIATDAVAPGIIAIQLTNRSFAEATTSGTGGSQTVTFGGFNLPIVASYLINLNIVAFNNTTAQGAVYDVIVGRRSNGTTLFPIGTDTYIEKEEGNMVNVIVTTVTTGTQINVQVTGINGQNISWVVVATYVSSQVI